MEKVKLWCGLCGEESVFSIKIERNADVETLQKAIVNEKKDINDRFNVDPTILTLYLARKKSGTWLKHDHAVKKLLQHDVDPEYEEMLSSWKLTKPELLGPDFQPEENEIHVLVKLPTRRVETAQLANLQALLLNHILMDTLTSTSVESGICFKLMLGVMYNCNMGNGKLRCMLLDMALPSELVVASHLFRRSNAFLCETMMGFSDIDDLRNGLLLFKPLKDAFGRLRISFIYNKSTDAFHLKVFDPKMRRKRLFDKLDAEQRAILLQGQTLPENWKTEGPRFAPGTSYDLQTTFGDVEERILCFQSAGRPYKRCLYVHALSARANALEKRWIQPGEIKFDDFWSEEMAVAEKISLFYPQIS